MTRDEKLRRAMRDQAEAMSDLNTFAIVVSTLEGGHIHAESGHHARPIITRAIAAQQACLRRYDRAVARAEHLSLGSPE